MNAIYESYAIMRDMEGMKDADVAKQTGISRSTFSEWKSGRSEPKIDKLYKIANIIHCNVNSFYIDFTPEAAKKKMKEEEEKHTFPMSDKEVNLINAWRLLQRDQKEAVGSLIDTFIAQNNHNNGTRRT